MGMYDLIDFFCPNCNEIIGTQSKAGLCELKRYRQDDIPANIAMDIVDERMFCDKCSHEYYISGSVPRVSLYLVPSKKGDYYD